MPAGRRTQYLHHGRKPVPPDGGYSSEVADPSNPPYAFLCGALLNRKIDPYGQPHHIYSSNSQLHCIDPKRFLRFFRKAVKNTLDIDLQDDETSVSSNLRSSYISSNPSSGTSSLPSNISAGTTAPSTTANMDESFSDGEQSPLYYQSSRSSTVPGKIITAANGTPIHVEPLPQSGGIHTQVSLHYAVTNHPGGNTGTVMITPTADMTLGNVQVKLSERDPCVMMLNWPKGSASKPKVLEAAFTKRTHVLSYAHQGRPLYQDLELDGSDAIVAGISETARETHGKNGSNGMNVFGIRFPKPIKPTLVAIPATNNTILPSKCMISPHPSFDGRAKEKVNQYMINFEYVSNDRDEANVESFDEDAPPTYAAGVRGMDSRHYDHGHDDYRQEFYHVGDSEPYGERHRTSKSKHRVAPPYGYGNDERRHSSKSKHPVTAYEGSSTLTEYQRNNRSDSVHPALKDFRAKYCNGGGDYDYDDSNSSQDRQGYQSPHHHLLPSVDERRDQGSMSRSMSRTTPLISNTTATARRSNVNRYSDDYSDASSSQMNYPGYTNQQRSRASSSSSTRRNNGTGVVSETRAGFDDVNSSRSSRGHNSGGGSVHGERNGTQMEIGDGNSGRGSRASTSRRSNGGGSVHGAVETRGFDDDNSSRSSRGEPWSRASSSSSSSSGRNNGTDDRITETRTRDTQMEIGDGNSVRSSRASTSRRSNGGGSVLGTAADANSQEHSAHHSNFTRSVHPRENNEPSGGNNVSGGIENNNDSAIPSEISADLNSMSIADDDITLSTAGGGGINSSNNRSSGERRGGGRRGDENATMVTLPERGGRRGGGRRRGRGGGRRGGGDDNATAATLPETRGGSYSLRDSRRVDYSR